MQSNNEPTKSSQQQEQPLKLVLTAADDQKLVRYLELLIKIDKRRKKERGNDYAKETQQTA